MVGEWKIIVDPISEFSYNNKLSMKGESMKRNLMENFNSIYS